MIVDLPWPHRDLSPEELADLRSTFSYDAETGEIIRIKRTGMNVKVGQPAGWTNRLGYRRIRYGGFTISGHRLAWVLHYGTIAPAVIDHMNGNPSDNRISNLRPSDHSHNIQNLRRARKDNVLGVLGVRRDRHGRFEARIMLRGQAIALGTFATVEEASEAYLRAKREIHNGCTI